MVGLKKPTKWRQCVGQSLIEMGSGCPNRLVPAAHT